MTRNPQRNTCLLNLGAIPEKFRKFKKKLKLSKKLLKTIQKKKVQNFINNSPTTLY